MKMDFSSLLSIAYDNEQQNKKKEGGFRTELSAPKREKQVKPRSAVVQKLIDEKNREKEQAEKEKREKEEKRKQAEEAKRKEEEKQKRFTIPKKKDKINELMKDLVSDSDGGGSDSSASLKRGSTVSELRHGSDKDNEKHNEHKHKHHKSSKHKSDYSEHKSEKHKSHKSEASLTDNADKKDRDKGNKNKSDYTEHKSEKHKNHSHEDKHSSKSEREKDRSHSKDRSQSHHSSKSSISHSDSYKKSSSSSSSAHGSSHRDSDEKTKHSSSSSGSSKHSSKDKERHSSKEKEKHSSKQKEEKESSKSGTKSIKDLSLDELRKQVREMKEFEANLAKEEEKAKKREEASVAHAVEFQKNRQGVELDEVEARKAKILSRTQQILERTKAKLAEDKGGQKQQRQRGKRSGGEKVSGKEGEKIKSKSIVKDDDDESDEDFVDPMDLSLNSDLKTESGDILKDIKKRIDEKMGNYDFSDRPLKEKKTRAKSVGDKRDSKKIHDKHRDKHKDKHKQKLTDKERQKREKIKEMMRKDYQNSFSGGSDEHPNPQKPKKPVIVRRFQQQPPPMNFNDLLKIAQEKCKEKAPEPVVKIPKKKEERPLTQEEIDRRKRAEEVKRKRMEEEKNYPAETPVKETVKDRASNDSAIKSKSDSSLLKGALTKHSGRNSPNVNSSQSKSGVSDKKSNENVHRNKPTTASSSKPVPAKEALNPFDRIVGQIQQRNPKPEKRKRPVLESSEEEDEYDEDDDFIDDDELPGDDISAHIRSIFGYDKSKYRDEDDDVDNMEANFATVMKEEARSAKIGKMEDLEDIRREEEELRRKKLAKKKMKY